MCTGSVYQSNVQYVYWIQLYWIRYSFVGINACTFGGLENQPRCGKIWISTEMHVKMSSKCKPKSGNIQNGNLQKCKSAKMQNLQVCESGQCNVIPVVKQTRRNT